MINLKNRSLLITGATGSFGRAFLDHLLTRNVNFKRIVIFSRDELKQHELQKIYSTERYPFLRFFLGDIRDLQRLNYAFKGIDYVVHAAALKQVPAAEYNPFEFIKTNIIGSQNIIEAAIYNNVKKIIALSTDKAVSPVNLYGATKLCAEKLFFSAQSFAASKKISFSVVRYGNVFGSRGSVFHEFKRQKEKKLFEITNKEMTRFNINMDEAIDMVLWVLKNSIGSEIFVPKLPSLRVIDLASAIDSKCKIIFTGIRMGEKIHEELISKGESQNAYDIKKYYVILNKNSNIIKYYLNKFKARKIDSSFVYESGTNKSFLSIDQIKKIISKYKKWN